MGKYVFTLLLLLAANSLMAQHLRNLNILLHKSDDRTVYLTEIQSNENHTYDQDGRSDIAFSYKTKVLTENSDKYFMSIGGAGVRFIPDTAGLYKIQVESGGGSTHYYSEKKTKDEYTNSEWLPGMREASPMPYTYFAGYSNDTTLAEVKILKILKEQTPSRIIYDSKELDEVAAFTLDGEKLDVAEYIKGELKRNPGEAIVNNVSGSVTFKYVVDENGWISQVGVDKLNINEKKYVPHICAGINYAITKYYYLNDQRHRWIPGKRKGEPVASRQYVTIDFR